MGQAGGMPPPDERRPAPPARPAPAARRPGLGHRVGGDRPPVRGRGARPAGAHVLRRRPPLRAGRSSRTSSRAAARPTRCASTACRCGRRRDSAFPPSRIRTARRRRPLPASPSAPAGTPARRTVEDSRGHPAGRAGPLRRAGSPALPEDQWPDALVLLGDQVYADELTTGDEVRGCTRRRRPRPSRGGARGPGRRLRGVHPALRRVLERPAGALAAVDDPVVDDLRRPRDDRRLEHLGRLARAGHRRAVVDTGGSAAAWSATGSTSTWATSARRSWRRTRPGRPSRASATTTDDAEPMLREMAEPPTPSRPASGGASCGTGATRG